MHCRIVAPKREKLQIALESLKQKEMALKEAMQQLQNSREQLGRLRRMYDAKMKEKEDLIRLASTPVFSYALERRKWPRIKPREHGPVKEVGLGPIRLRPPVQHL